MEGQTGIEPAMRMILTGSQPVASPFGFCPGTPREIRTPNLPIRSRMRYPVAP